MENETYTSDSACSAKSSIYELYTDRDIRAQLISKLLSTRMHDNPADLINSASQLENYILNGK